jgi:hypothetical protein
MLRKLLPLMIGASAAIALPAAAGPRANPDEQLERAIAGRVAGEPVDCIDLHSVRNSRVIDHTAILYEIGSTLYVNRPRSGAESLNQWDTQVVHPLGTRLCSIDTVRVVDPVTHFQTGAVFLGDFVPYRRERNGD